MDAKQYDDIVNEGGEGYNPIRAERERKEHEAINSMPRTRDDIMTDIERLDNSIARESGTYDAQRIAALRDELSALDAAEEAAFRAEWTADVTAGRRAEWNEWVKRTSNGTGRIDSPVLMRKQGQQGWTIDQLKRAVAMYK